MGAKFELNDNGAGFGSIKLNGEELEYVTGVTIVTKVNCLPIVRVDFLATEVLVNLDDCADIDDISKRLQKIEFDLQQREEYDREQAEYE